MKNKLLWITCLFVALSCHRSQVIIYPAPEQETKSDDFEMFVNDKPVFIYQARVSKYPINQIWPGYQRPMNQTEMASFAYFDFKGEVEIKIISNREIKTLDIRPKEFNIEPDLKGNAITFKLSKSLQFVVEVNGYHHALHIFANPIEKFELKKDDPSVHYFGPGIHDAGVINVKSNETVFIDGGAVVHGVVTSENARNIKIIGRGILDASKIARGEAPQMISLRRVANGYISGIILRDPHLYTVAPTNCDSIAMDNIKLIGLWRYNTDGIHPTNSKNITIRNCFVRAFDDAIVMSAEPGAYKEPFHNMENIFVDNCVIWNDWGRAFEIGAGTFADTIRNIRFTNSYIPHFTSVAMDIQNCDRAYITDIHYENISVEEPILDSVTLGSTPLFANAWGKIIVLGIYGSHYSSDTIRGHIDNIYFSNIRYNNTDTTILNYTGYDSLLYAKDSTHFVRDNMYYGDIKYNSTHSNKIYLSGYNSNHNVSHISIEDFYINNNKVTDLSLIGKNEFVYKIKIK